MHACCAAGGASEAQQQLIARAWGQALANRGPAPHDMKVRTPKAAPGSTMRPVSVMLSVAVLCACNRSESTASFAQPSDSQPGPLVSASAPKLAADRVCPDPEQEGWNHWEDSDTGTVLYVARTRATTPAPIEWEPCGPGARFDVPCLREAAVAPSTPTHLFFAKLAPGAYRLGASLEDGNATLTLEASA